jgi:hypothetical protein
MANKALGGGTVACADEAWAEERQPYAWLEDYLDRLKGKDEYRKFREQHDYAHEYYTLMASLWA